MVLATPTNLKDPVLSRFSLHGKVAAVTGGARGIGLEICRAFAEAGADGIAMLYSTTSSETANSLAAEMERSTSGIVGSDADASQAKKPRIRTYQADVTSQPAMEAVLEQIASDFGHLDIVVANAGIVEWKAAVDMSSDAWRKVMAVNLDGAFYTAQAGARIFKKQFEARSGSGGTKTQGNVIFTSSVSASIVNLPQRQACYNSSKAAVNQLAKALAVEWVDFCRVNTVSPGYIVTDMVAHRDEDLKEQWLAMVPGRRMAEATELKGAYVFLASDASSYMTGADLIIDGGYSLP